MVSDQGGLQDGLEQKGNWTITGNLAPTNDSLSPSNPASAVGTPRALRAKYSDPNGYGNIMQTFVQVKGFGGLRAMYNRVENKLYLQDDAGTSYGTGYAPGSNNVISNSRGSLNCKETTVFGSGNTLTVTWNLTPSAGLIGTPALYLSVRDRGGLADATEMFGTWSITSGGGTVASRPNEAKPSIRSASVTRPTVHHTVYLAAH
jgi:hypothetical protein